MRLRPVSATTITPLEATTAMPLGLLKLARAPGPSANAGDPSPASVVTTPLFAGHWIPLTTSAAVAFDAPAPASPAAPHSSTAAHDELGAAHWTQAARLHAELPDGRAIGALPLRAVR